MRVLRHVKSASGGTILPPLSGRTEAARIKFIAFAQGKFIPAQKVFVTHVHRRIGSHVKAH